MTQVEPVRQAVRVAVPARDAFAAFVDGFGHWWPREYTWSGESLEAIGIEPRPGGACWERGPYGFRLDWGRVLAWEPPHRLGFSWQLGMDRLPIPNPSQASVVEVRFTPHGTETAVELTHEAFGRHGADGAAYRDAMAAPQGWPRILERYAASVQPADVAPWSALST